MSPLKVRIGEEVYRVVEDGRSMSVRLEGVEVARASINEGVITGRRGIKAFHSSPVDEKEDVRQAIGQLVKSLSITRRNEQKRAKENEIVSFGRIWRDGKNVLAEWTEGKVTKQGSVDDFFKVIESYRPVTEAAAPAQAPVAGPVVAAAPAPMTSLMQRLVSGEVKANVGESEEVIPTPPDDTPPAVEVPTVQGEGKSLMERMKAGASESTSTAKSLSNGSGALAMLKANEAKHRDF